MPGLMLPSKIDLDPSTLDDLIYASRTADLPFLQESFAALSNTHSTTPTRVLFSATDSSTQNTLLHYPAANGSLDILNYLLSLLPIESESESAFVNSKNSAGNTPLHWAALNGHIECVKALMGKGADPGLLNAAGKDAVWEAEAGGKEGGEQVVGWLEREGKNLERGIGGTNEEGGEEADVALRNGATQGQTETLMSDASPRDGDGDAAVK